MSPPVQIEMECFDGQLMTAGTLCRPPTQCGGADGKLFGFGHYFLKCGRTRELNWFIFSSEFNGSPCLARGLHATELLNPVAMVPPTNDANAVPVRELHDLRLAIEKLASATAQVQVLYARHGAARPAGNMDSGPARVVD